MNKQVKELRERVRLTLEEIDAAWPAKTPQYDTIEETLEKGILIGAKAIAKAQLNKVLNDPDLALIDKCKPCEGTGYLPDDDTGEPNPPVGGIRCPHCEGPGIIVLPLVDEFKEKAQDKTNLHEWGSPEGLPNGWRGRILGEKK